MMSPIMHMTVFTPELQKRLPLTEMLNFRNRNL